MTDPNLIERLLWWVFASLAILSALMTVTRRNPMASLLFLVLTFFSLAALYVLLGAHFIAAIQVIVYAGAIMVLFLFVIMLLNLGHDFHADIRSGLWIVLGGVCAGLIGFALTRNVLARGVATRPEVARLADNAVVEHGAVGAIAFPLFQDFLVPFELTSVLLLVAVIGAVILAKRRV
jgi:NADH-quinone oxidoreductase subunit J